MYWTIRIGIFHFVKGEDILKHNQEACSRFSLRANFKLTLLPVTHHLHNPFRYGCSNYVSAVEQCII